VTQGKSTFLKAQVFYTVSVSVFPPILLDNEKLDIVIPSFLPVYERQSTMLQWTAFNSAHLGEKAQRK
jgi:hypothetical protein